MKRIDTLLLLALPASGKSEIRRYLDHVAPGVALRDFHLGPTVQLDDYPYVRLMGLLDEAIEAAGGSRVFFESRNGLMAEPRDWGTLAALLREDYATLGVPRPAPERPTEYLVQRFDDARASTGAQPVSNQIDRAVLDRVAEVLDDDIGAFVAGLAAELDRYDDESTVVVELARGGPEGATFPLAAPHGYEYTLPHLGGEMLDRASVLHVWVTPEQSRQRNLDRAGHVEDSVLHHRVPDVVMRRNYGTDDLPWLIEQGSRTITVPGLPHPRRLQAAVFDNRSDYTSMLRTDPAEWAEADVAALRRQLRISLEGLGRNRSPDV